MPKEPITVDQLIGRSVRRDDSGIKAQAPFTQERAPGPTGMPNFRERFPMYNQYTDEQLLGAIKQRFPQYEKFADDELAWALNEKFQVPGTAAQTPERPPMFATAPADITEVSELGTGAEGRLGPAERARVKILQQNQPQQPQSLGEYLAAEATRGATLGQIDRLLTPPQKQALAEKGEEKVWVNIPGVGWKNVKLNKWLGQAAHMGGAMLPWGTVSKLVGLGAQAAGLGPEIMGTSTVGREAAKGAIRGMTTGGVVGGLTYVEDETPEQRMRRILATSAFSGAIDAAASGWLANRGKKFFEHAWEKYADDFQQKQGKKAGPKEKEWFKQRYKERIQDRAKRYKKQREKQSKGKPKSTEEGPPYYNTWSQAKREFYDEVALGRRADPAKLNRLKKKILSEVTDDEAAAIVEAFNSGTLKQEGFAWFKTLERSEKKQILKRAMKSRQAAPKSTRRPDTGKAAPGKQQAPKAKKRPQAAKQPKTGTTPRQALRTPQQSQDALTRIRNRFPEQTKGLTDQQILQKATQTESAGGLSEAVRRIAGEQPAAKPVQKQAPQPAPKPAVEEPKDFSKTKIVDERGKPKIVYHGTEVEFDKFDINKTDTEDIRAFYFTPSKSTARLYATKPGPGGKGLAEGPIIPANVNLENPLIVSAKDWHNDTGPMKNLPENKTKATEALKKQGYDGVLIKKYTGDDPMLKAGFANDIIGVFDPKQISRVKEVGAKKPTPATKPKPKPKKTPIKTKESKRYKVVEAPVKDISTDVEKFQERPGEFSERSVESIIRDVKNDDFNWGKFEPIKVWENPVDNQTYVLAGHSRLEAFRRLNKQGFEGFDEIPAVYYDAPTIKEAVKFAKRESNVLGDRPGPVSRAGVYREMRQEGATKKEIRKEAKKLEGRDANRIINYSHLNPKGTVIKSLEQFDKAQDFDSTANLEKAADWIGAARRKFDNLTDLHEQEMFNYLKDKKNFDKIGNKQNFLETVRLKANNMLFDPNKPLNLKKVKPKGHLEKNFQNELQKLENFQKKLNERRVQLENKQKVRGLPDKEQKILQNKLEKVNKDIKKVLDQQSKLMDRRKDFEQDQKRQTSLFEKTIKYLGQNREGIYYRPEQVKDFEKNLKKLPETFPESQEAKIAFGGAERFDDAIQKLNWQLTRKATKEGDYSQVKQILKKRKSLDYNRVKIKDHRDIADVLQVFRNPNIEHFHAIAVNTNGTVIGHRIVTSGHVGHVSENLKDLFAWIDKKKPVKVYFGHNHPTGKVQPSEEDMQFTMQLSERLKEKFGSHVITNGDKYANLSREGKIIWKNEHFFRSPQGEFKHKGEVGGFEGMLNTVSGKDIPDDKVLLIGTASIGKIKHFGYINKTDLHSKKRLFKALDEIGEEAGADAFFLAGRNVFRFIDRFPENFRGATQKGRALIDVFDTGLINEPVSHRFLYEKESPLAGQQEAIIKASAMGDVKVVAQEKKPYWAENYINRELKGVKGAARKAYRKGLHTFLSLVEPAKLTEWQEGIDVAAKIIRKQHEHVKAGVEFLEKLEAGQAGKSMGELMEFLDNTFTRKELDYLQRARKPAKMQQGKKVYEDALKNVPKELQNSKEWRALWDDVRTASDYAHKQMINYLQKWVIAENKGQGRLFTDRDLADANIMYVKDYFYGKYKNNDALEDFLDDISNRINSFVKNKHKFVNPKTFDTYADIVGVYPGIELKHPNPIRNILDEIYDINRIKGQFEMREYLLEEIGDTGIARIVKGKRSKRPKGWKRVGSKNDLVWRDVFAHPDVARLINNYLRPNFFTSGRAGRTLLGIQYGLKAAKFIGSLFHGHVIAKQVLNDTGYFGFLNPKHVIKSAKHLQPLTNWSWNKVKEDPARWELYRDYVNVAGTPRGGGGVGYDLEHQMIDAFKQVTRKLDVKTKGKLGQVSLKAGMLPADFIKWMFEEWIPLQKFQAYEAHLSKWEQEKGRPLTDGEKLLIIREGDNFYGEMNERALGMSGTVSTMMRWFYLAPMYSVGNIRTMFKGVLQWNPGSYGPGARSRANMVNSLISSAILATAARMAVRALMPEEERKEIRKLPKNMNDIRDIYKIPLPYKDSNGDRLYTDMLTYDRDYYILFGNILEKEFGNIAPEIAERVGGVETSLFSITTDLSKMVQGQAVYDWKDDELYNIKDDDTKEMLNWVKYQVNQMMPIPVSQYKYMRNKGVKDVDAFLLSVIGTHLIYNEETRREKEHFKKFYNLGDDRKKLFQHLATIDNPIEEVEKFNRAVMEIYNNPEVGDRVKKAIKKHYIDLERYIDDIQSKLKSPHYDPASKEYWSSVLDNLYSDTPQKKANN